MPLAELPPENVEPGRIIGLTPKSLSVSSWSPGRLEDNVRPTQVLLRISAEETPNIEIAIRFRGAQTLDDMIDALRSHRETVFGVRL